MYTTLFSTPTVQKKLSIAEFYLCVSVEDIKQVLKSIHCRVQWYFQQKFIILFVKIEAEIIKNY